MAPRLAELIRSQLAPYFDRSGSQITVEGPPVSLRPEAAQSLGLALHELATNAAQFGALSSPAGRISITWAWQRDRDPAVGRNPVGGERWAARSARRSSAGSARSWSNEISPARSRRRST